MMSVFLYLRVACDESCPNRRLGKLGVRTRVLETKPGRVFDCVVSMKIPRGVHNGIFLLVRHQAASGCVLQLVFPE